MGKNSLPGIHPLSKGRSYQDFFQLPVSDLSEWRHICHFFRWQKMWRVTFVTFLGRMWRSRTRKYFFNLWRFLSHPSRKTSYFGPAGTKKFWTGRNVTIRLGLKNAFLFPSQISHISRKRVCFFVLLYRYWGIITVPGSIPYGSRPGVDGSSPSTLTTSLVYRSPPLPLRTDPQLFVTNLGHRRGIFF